MTRIIPTATFALLMTTLAASADLIDWGNVNTMEPVLDRFGATVPDGSSFLITLWEDGANNILEPYGSVSSDDFQVGTLTTTFFNGLFSLSFDPVMEGVADGETIYTVVFDAATIGSSSFFAILDPGGTIVQDSSSPTPLGATIPAEPSQLTGMYPSHQAWPLYASVLQEWQHDDYGNAITGPDRLSQSVTGHFH